MTSKVVVAYVTGVTVVMPFYKGKHGCDHRIVFCCMVDVKLLVNLVRALVHNAVEVISGDDVQLVLVAECLLELLPLGPAAHHAFTYTCERNSHI